jgi:hypothetical protein
MSKNDPNFLDFRDEWRRQVMGDTRLSAAQKVVAFVIADRVSFDGDVFRLSHVFIEAITGASENTVRRTIIKLLEIDALGKYIPGHNKGGYKYTSIFQINDKFLSDNPIANGDGGSPSWQVSLILNGETDVFLPHHQRGGRKTQFATPSPVSPATPSPVSLATPSPARGIPSSSIDYQEDGRKEGNTDGPSSGGCAKAAPPPSVAGFKDLVEEFAGKCQDLDDAETAYHREIEIGRATHEHLVDRAKAQAASILGLPYKDRPKLQRWIAKQFYNRDDSATSSDDQVEYVRLKA